MDGATCEPRPNGHRYQGKLQHLTFLLSVTDVVLLLIQCDSLTDDLGLTSQYTSPWKRYDSSIAQKVHYTGNGTKSLHISVEASLRKLRTDYIDILYVHWYDWDTGVQELMGSLHHLVAAGKVLHLVSGTPVYFSPGTTVILICFSHVSNVP